MSIFEIAADFATELLGETAAATASGQVFVTYFGYAACLAAVIVAIKFVRWICRGFK